MAGFIAIAFAAMAIALTITPAVSVSAFGQTVEVGAVPVVRSIGLSGPGEADLFGEGTISTVQNFDGPIRPRISWQRFNRNDEAGAFIQSNAENGQRTIQTGTAAAGQLLADGWKSYFVRLVLLSGLIGGGLYLAALGGYALISGHNHKHRSRRYRAAQLGTAVGLSMAVTIGCAALTVTSAASQLATVTSLSDLVGTASLIPIPGPVGPSHPDVDVVVIGDSTAAGIGNTPLPNPSKDDEACRRSQDTYATALQAASGYKVLNLACSSATIANGLLGTQNAEGRDLDPQFGRLQAIQSAKFVVVSIGANDVGWSDYMKLCYGLPRCDDQLTDSLFQRRLDDFKIQYSQLLQQLSSLPSHPTVVVNQYYDPFGQSFDCDALADPEASSGAPAGYGLAADPGKDNQEEKIRQKVNPLKSQLTRLNDVLRNGAEAFGFLSVRPHFEGHELCTDQSWVQGMRDAAPFHPTAAGGLAIAAADLPLIANSN